MFNPWLNLHRPCLFATEVVSLKGKIVKRYRHADVKTPLECLANPDGLNRPEAWLADTGYYSEKRVTMSIPKADEKICCYGSEN